MTTLEFLRQFRIGGYTIFDFAASFLGIFLLSPLLSKLFKKLLRYPWPLSFKSCDVGLADSWNKRHENN